MKLGIQSNFKLCYRNPESSFWKMSLEEYFIPPRSAGAAGCELQGSSGRPWPGLLPPPLLPLHSPSAHTALPGAGSGSSPQESPSWKDTHFAEPGLPGLQLLTSAPPLRARTPAGKSSHLGQSISHPLHAVPCESSKPKSSHRARGNQCSYYGLEIRQGLSSLNPCFI